MPRSFTTEPRECGDPPQAASLDGFPTSTGIDPNPCGASSQAAKLPADVAPTVRGWTPGHGGTEHDRLGVPRTRGDRPDISDQLPAA